MVAMQAALIIMEITSTQKSMNMVIIITMKADLAVELICPYLRLQK